MASDHSYHKSSCFYSNEHFWKETGPLVFMWVKLIGSGRGREHQLGYPGSSDLTHSFVLSFGYLACKNESQSRRTVSIWLRNRAQSLRGGGRIPRSNGARILKLRAYALRGLSRLGRPPSFREIRNSRHKLVLKIRLGANNNSVLHPLSLRKPCISRLFPLSASALILITSNYSLGRNSRRSEPTSGLNQ